MKNIQDSDSFAANLARERARRERYGVGYSVLSINVEERAGRRLPRALSRIAGDRLRSTDCVGWMDEGSLAVLLPETDAMGARRVAQDLSESLAKAVGARPWLDNLAI